MAELFNILLNGNEISCDYSPEKSGEIGHMIVNVNTGEISNIIYSKYPYGKNMYAGQVRAKLMQLLKNCKVLPKTAAAVWF